MDFTDDEVIAAAYSALLGRLPDSAGLAHWRTNIRSTMNMEEVFRQIANSPEARKHNTRSPLDSLHLARGQMIFQLPKARSIVDLGGGAINDPRGGLVAMQYPYDFDTISIIEPPPIQRHEIYKEIPDLLDSVKTPQGEVRYVYTSMADLSTIATASVDLVFSGETIEHVTLEDCKRTLKEVRRVLKPSGHFCFDTPNRSITEIQFPTGYINPDHKIEYRHHEMMALLRDASLLPVEIKGITYMPRTMRDRIFHSDEMVSNVGMYSDYEVCYLLYYKCIPA